MNAMKRQRITIGAAFLATGLALSGAAVAITPLAQGYMLGADPAAQASQANSAEPTMGMVKGGGMFASMDANKDGSVTREEAAAFHAAHFKKVDANGDGVLTRPESAAGMKAMHEACCGMKMMGGEGMTKMMGGEGMCGGKK